MRGFPFVGETTGGRLLAQRLPKQALVGRALEDQQMPVLFLMQARVRPEVNELPALRSRRGQLCLEGRPIDLALAHARRAVGQRDRLKAPRCGGLPLWAVKDSNLRPWD